MNQEIQFAGDEYSTITITGNYTTNDTACVIVRALSGTGANPNKYVTLDGRFVSKAKNVISDTRNTPDLPITYRGVYKTLATGHSVTYAEEKFTYDNARLIVADTTKEDTETDVGTNLDIIVMDTYSNTLVSNADVTELVSPITRDENINY